MQEINKYQDIYSIIPQLVYSEDDFSEDKMHLFYTPKIIVIYENFTVLLVFESLKNHIMLQHAQFVCLCAVNYPKRNFDMELAYELLSFTYNDRLRLKSYTNSFYEAYTITKIYKSGDWWEREAWELFGITFILNDNLRRLLTDYGFEGWPMRKVSSCFGLTEIEYDGLEHRLFYKNTSFAQESRIFHHELLWA